MQKIMLGDRYGKLTVIEKTNVYNKSNRVLYRCSCDCGEETLIDQPQIVRPQNPSCGKCTTRTGIELPYNQKFGKLQLLRTYEFGKRTRYVWQCDCGNEHEAPLANVTGGLCSSCGCLGKELGIADINYRYAGKKYNSLTFIKHAGKWAGPGEGKNPIAVWKCDCGNEKEILLDSVKFEKTTCCGCQTGWDGGEYFIGSKWNSLTLVAIAEKKNTQNIGLFECDCGNTIKTKITSVRTGRTKSCGCIRSEVQRTSRGFTLDESKFETITDDSAYWLGFLLADGNVSKNTITINLKTSDVPHLEKFRDFMGGNQIISLKKDNRVSGYAFGSIKVAKDLARWGIVPNKSYIAEAPEELKHNEHFWRGVIDGDGTISKTAIGLCGTKKVCQDFLNFAKTVIGTKAEVQQVKENLWQTRVGVSRKESSKLARLLYDNDVVHLDRKYDKAMKIVERVDSRV